MSDEVPGKGTLVTRCVNGSTLVLLQDLDWFCIVEVQVSPVPSRCCVSNARDAGTAFPFALKLVELLCGKAKRDEVREPMMFPPGTAYPY